MEKAILTDPAIKPEGSVLESALGKNYKRFLEFADKISALDLVLEWRYYNDGGWLCKVLNKKKNLCWLSVWDIGFKLGIFFTEKTIGGIQELKIDDEIKDMAKNSKAMGKILPVVILVGNKKMLDSALKVLEYKKSLK